jgi:hypothetical protein
VFGPTELSGPVARARYQRIRSERPLSGRPDFRRISIHSIEFDHVGIGEGWSATVDAGAAGRDVQVRRA